ncbi:hypothetical protein OFC56_36950, partial [Escherichia coli]|nr:hypothetical protein [Escherichia coli]
MALFALCRLRGVLAVVALPRALARARGGARARACASTAGSASDAEDDADASARKHKVAIVLGYDGSFFAGSQLNSDL